MTTDPLQKHRSRCKRWSDLKIDLKLISFDHWDAFTPLMRKAKLTPVSVRAIYRVEQIRRYQEHERRETIRRHSMRKRPRLLRRPHWAGAPGY